MVLTLLLVLVVAAMTEMPVVVAVVGLVAVVAMVAMVAIHDREEFDFSQRRRVCPVPATVPAMCRQTVQRHGHLACCGYHMHRDIRQRGGVGAQPAGAWQDQP